MLGAISDGLCGENGVTMNWLSPLPRFGVQTPITEGWALAL